MVTINVRCLQQTGKQVLAACTAEHVGFAPDTGIAVWQVITTAHGVDHPDFILYGYRIWQIIRFSEAFFEEIFLVAWYMRTSIGYGWMVGLIPAFQAASRSGFYQRAGE